MPVDQVARTGLAEPLDREPAFDQLIAAAHAIARLGVHVRPFPGALESTPPVAAPHEVTAFGNLPLPRDRLPPLLHPVLRIRLRRHTKDQHAPARPQHPEQLALVAGVWLAAQPALRGAGI